MDIASFVESLYSNVWYKDLTNDFDYMAYTSFVYIGFSLILRGIDLYESRLK